MPGHVQEHVDYITPGIKLFVPNRRQGADIEKRTFGVTSGTGNAGTLPPMRESLPMTIQQLIALGLLAVCDQIITPQCVKGRTVIFPLYERVTDVLPQPCIT